MHISKPHSHAAYDISHSLFSFFSGTFISQFIRLIERNGMWFNRIFYESVDILLWKMNIWFNFPQSETLIKYTINVFGDMAASRMCFAATKIDAAHKIVNLHAKIIILMKWKIYFIGMFWILLPPAVDEIEGMSMFCKWCMPFGRPICGKWVCVWLWSYHWIKSTLLSTIRLHSDAKRSFRKHIKTKALKKKNGFCTNFDIPTLLRWLEANVLWQLCFVCECSLAVFVRSKACAIIFIHCVITS